MCNVLVWGVGGGEGQGAYSYYLGPVYNTPVSSSPPDHIPDPQGLQPAGGL